MNYTLIKEKIENYKDIRRNIWTAILLLTGGLAGLLLAMGDLVFNIAGTIKVSLFIIGVFLDALLMNYVADCSKEIIKLLSLIEKGE